MKKFLGILAVVALIASPAIAVTSVTMNTTGGGSPYRATVVSGPVGIWQSGTFDTFCVERGEYFNPGSTVYTVKIGTYAINGGNEHPAYDPTNADVLDVATTWLYREWMTKHTGTGTSQTLTVGTITVNAAQVQNVIWALEDELSNVSDKANRDALGNGSQQALYDKAREMAGDTYVAADNDYTTNRISSSNNPFGVMAMNLYYPDGRIAQSQLVQVPAPGAALLVALGLGLVGWVKKRLA